MLKIFTRKNKKSKLDEVIESTLEYMSKVSPESEDYTTISENLERLYKMKANEHENKISPDTMALVIGNLLGIGVILWHEKANIITSKALGFVLKGRV